MSISIRHQQRVEQRYNKLGIRRIRLVDASLVRSVKDGIVLLTGDATVEDFIVPREIEAHFTCTKAPHESGDVAWVQALNFNGVRALFEDWTWLQEQRYVKYVAVVETNNLEVYILGGPREQGLKLQAAGGTNATHIAYSLQAPQLSTPIPLRSDLTFLTAISIYAV